MASPPCKFCQKETAYVPLTLSHSGISAIKINAYFCHDCQYEYAPIGGMKYHHLYKMVNNRMYRWSIEDTTKVARLWYVGQPGIPGQVPNKDLKILKTFEDHYPEITPENVERKLKFILLFL